MADTITGESNKDRARLAREAGIGKLSLLAILAGAVTAFGSFAILLALVSAIAGAVGANTDLGTLDWREVGVGAGITVAVALLLAYLFGGYVAGRMARRAGWLNGLAVFVLAILVPAILAASSAPRPTRSTPTPAPPRSGTCAASASRPRVTNGPRSAPSSAWARCSPCSSGRCWAGSSASAGTASSRVRSTPRPAPSSTSQPGATTTEATTTAEQPA
jgi:hypothetical protein